MWSLASAVLGTRVHGDSIQPSSETPFITRELTQGEHTITVEIEAPIPGDRGWECHWRISGWPSSPTELITHGIDGVQALLLAMRMIDANLALEERHHGPILFLDTPNNWQLYPG